MWRGGIGALVREDGLQQVQQVDVVVELAVQLLERVRDVLGEVGRERRERAHRRHGWRLAQVTVVQRVAEEDELPARLMIWCLGLQLHVHEKLQQQEHP